MSIDDVVGKWQKDHFASCPKQTNGPLITFSNGSTVRIAPGFEERFLSSQGVLKVGVRCKACGAHSETFEELIP